MASELELINAALGHLGEEKLISDPDADPPPRALRVARALVPAMLDAAIRKHPWQCAQVRRVLPRLDALAGSDWRYPSAFGLPEAFLRVVVVATGRQWELGSLPVYDAANPSIEIARRKVLFASGEQALQTVLLERPPFETLDAALFDYLGFELAARMAGPMQADKALAQLKRQEAKAAWDDAVAAEISEFGNDPAPLASTWLAARGAGDVICDLARDYDLSIVQDHGLL